VTAQQALDFPVTTQAESYIVKRLREHGAFIYPVSDAFPLKERIPPRDPRYQARRDHHRQEFCDQEMRKLFRML
jgi:hypothetical protein